MNRLFYVLGLFLVSCSGGYFGGEERRFKQLVQEDFEEQVRENPELSSLLGLKYSKNRWNDLSEPHLQTRWKKADENLKKLAGFDVSSFSRKFQISWKLFKLLMEEEKTKFDFRFHSYIAHSLFGFPFLETAFLIDVHTIENIQEAEDYIERVREVQKRLDQVIFRLQESSKRGLIPPKFLFPKTAENIKSLLKGRPLDSEGEHILVRDFNKKISALNLSSFKKGKLNQKLEQALLEFYRPAYEKLLSYWQKLSAKAGNNTGLWSQPQGGPYYEFLIRQMTRADLTPEEVYQWGLKEVRRLHLEVTQFKNTLDFKGSLLDFFNFFRNNRKFYYRNGEVYITQFQKTVSELKKSRTGFFKKLPPYPLHIKRLESFREKTLGVRFYQPPSIGGSRPGIFYINLHRMNVQPKYALKALAFRETFPGRHFQTALSLDLKSLPLFQRYAQFPAFTEGWTLYAERLADEMGFYTKKYDQFGVLASELLRACGLVVDTGIHYRKWSRGRAIRYLIQNSDLSYDSAVQFVEEVVLNPGYATAGMAGFLKILEMRDLSKRTLGEKFDLREFHHHLLKNGSTSLMVLEENIRHWLSSS